MFSCKYGMSLHYLILFCSEQRLYGMYELNVCKLFMNLENIKSIVL